MATNKHALIRYRTIDRCLQNRSKLWDLDALIQACSDALYEYEGKDANVSKRTLQLDIQNMRSNKLGYNAPIIVHKKKYYTYSNPNYALTDVPLTSLDMDVLTESVSMLRQFKDFSLFEELSGIIQKLEDRIYSETSNSHPIIHLEKNENLKGLSHLDTLYQAILKQFVLNIEYKSFKSRKSNTIHLHPYLLKEFNNRWFLVGRSEGAQNIMNLALDRIESIELDFKTDYKMINFNPDDYYKNTYGVTVLSDSDIIDIELKVDKWNAPYVATKPIHASQEIKEVLEDKSMIFTLRVHHNYEIERLILGFGSSMEVLKPRRLRNKIKRTIKNSFESYFEVE